MMSSGAASKLKLTKFFPVSDWLNEAERRRRHDDSAAVTSTHQFEAMQLKQRPPGRDIANLPLPLFDRPRGAQLLKLCCASETSSMALTVLARDTISGLPLVRSYLRLSLPVYLTCFCCDMRQLLLGNEAAGLEIVPALSTRKPS